MQTHQLAIARDQFAGNIPAAGFTTQQDARDGLRVQFIGLGSQPASLCKLMGLPGVEQTQFVAMVLEKVIEVLPIA